jgi:hypothetical protein
VTLSEKGASLKSVFNNIRAQTGYFFFYDEALLNKTKPITLHVNDKTMN